MLWGNGGRRDTEGTYAKGRLMDLLALTKATRVTTIDEQLRRLATQLHKVRGEHEYAAEASVLEQVDILLDRRLHLSSSPTADAADPAA